MLSPTSEATITWDIEDDAKSGTYRIRHLGDHKMVFGGGTASFSGTSSTFDVVNHSARGNLSVS